MFLEGVPFRKMPNLVCSGRNETELTTLLGPGEGSSATLKVYEGIGIDQIWGKKAYLARSYSLPTLTGESNDAPIIFHAPGFAPPASYEVQLPLKIISSLACVTAINKGNRPLRIIW